MKLVCKLMILGCCTFVVGCGGESGSKTAIQSTNPAPKPPGGGGVAADGSVETTAPSSVGAAAE